MIDDVDDDDDDDVVRFPLDNIWPPLGNFTSQDVHAFLRCFCVASSSLQISATLVGRFTRNNDSLRKTSTTIAQTNIKIQARENSLTHPLRHTLKVTLQSFKQNTE